MLKQLHSFSVFQISYLVFFTALPFVYSDSFIDPVLIPRQAFLTLFLLFTWVLLLFTKKFRDHSFRISRLSLLFILCHAALVVLSFISILYSTTYSESIYVASKYGLVFLFFITTYFLLNAGFLFKKDLVNGVLAFCSISLLYGAYDLLLLVINDLDVLKHSDLITATCANKNLFASALLLCFWAVFSLDIRWLRHALAALLAVFALLLQSKIVALAFLILFLLLALKDRKLHFKKSKVVLITGSVLILTVFVLLFLNLNRFAQLSNLHTLDTRLGLWNNSFKMAAEYPFGVGAGNWQIFFPKYGLSHFDVPEIRNGRILYHQPHNDLIWMLCELGIFGLIAYLSLFIIPAVMLRRALQNKDQQLPFLLLINLAGYCLVAFFDFPLERIEHQVLLAVITVLAMSCYDPISKKQAVIRPLRFSPAYLALIVLSCVVCYYRLKGEYFTRQFIVLHKARQANEVIAGCDKAGSFFYSIDPVSMPVDWHAGIALFSQGRLEEAGHRFEKAYRYTPYNIRVLNDLATVYDQQGRHDKATELYRSALAISPTASLSPLK